MTEYDDIRDECRPIDQSIREQYRRMGREARLEQQQQADLRTISHMETNDPEEAARQKKIAILLTSYKALKVNSDVLDLKCDGYADPEYISRQRRALREDARHIRDKLSELVGTEQMRIMVKDARETINNLPYVRNQQINYSQFPASREYPVNQQTQQALNAHAVPRRLGNAPKQATSYLLTMEPDTQPGTYHLVLDGWHSAPMSESACRAAMLAGLFDINTLPPTKWYDSNITRSEGLRNTATALHHTTSAKRIETMNSWIPNAMIIGLVGWFVCMICPMLARWSLVPISTFVVMCIALMVWPEHCTAAAYRLGSTIPALASHVVQHTRWDVPHSITTAEVLGRARRDISLYSTDIRNLAQLHHALHATQAMNPAAIDDAILRMGQMVHSLSRTLPTKDSLDEENRALFEQSATTYRDMYARLWSLAEQAAATRCAEIETEAEATRQIEQQMHNERQRELLASAASTAFDEQSIIEAERELAARQQVRDQ